MAATLFPGGQRQQQQQQQQQQQASFQDTSLPWPGSFQQLPQQLPLLCTNSSLPADTGGSSPSTLTGLGDALFSPSFLKSPSLSATTAATTGCNPTDADQQFFCFDDTPLPASFATAMGFAEPAPLDMTTSAAPSATRLSSSTFGLPTASSLDSLAEALADDNTATTGQDAALEMLFGRKRSVSLSDLTSLSTASKDRLPSLSRHSRTASLTSQLFGPGADAMRGTTANVADDLEGDLYTVAFGSGYNDGDDLNDVFCNDADDEADSDSRHAGFMNTSSDSYPSDPSSTSGDASTGNAATACSPDDTSSTAASVTRQMTGVTLSPASASAAAVAPPSSEMIKCQRKLAQLSDMSTWPKERHLRARLLARKSRLKRKLKECQQQQVIDGLGMKNSKLRSEMDQLAKQKSSLIASVRSKLSPQLLQNLKKHAPTCIKRTASAAASMSSDCANEDTVVVSPQKRRRTNKQGPATASRATRGNTSAAARMRSRQSIEGGTVSPRSSVSSCSSATSRSTNYSRWSSLGFSTDVLGAPHHRNDSSVLHMNA